MRFQGTNGDLEMLLAIDSYRLLKVLKADPPPPPPSTSQTSSTSPLTSVTGQLHPPPPPEYHVVMRRTVLTGDRTNRGMFIRTEPLPIRSDTFEGAIRAADTYIQRNLNHGILARFPMCF